MSWDPGLYISPSCLRHPSLHFPAAPGLILCPCEFSAVWSDKEAINRPQIQFLTPGQDYWADQSCVGSGSLENTMWCPTGCQNVQTGDLPSVWGYQELEAWLCIFCTQCPGAPILTMQVCLSRPQWMPAAEDPTLLLQRTPTQARWEVSLVPTQDSSRSTWLGRVRLLHIHTEGTQISVEGRMRA